MIIDGHCHIWEKWPYQPRFPTVPRVLWVLYEMDGAGVERAVALYGADR